jgi:hypothetical protein
MLRHCMTPSATSPGYRVESKLSLLLLLQVDRGTWQASRNPDLGKVGSKGTEISTPNSCTACAVRVSLLSKATRRKAMTCSLYAVQSPHMPHSLQLSSQPTRAAVLS